MPRPLPIAVLLLALVGGGASASVHLAHHGTTWAAERAVHLAGGAHDAGADLLTPPCADDTAHEAPCGVCQTVHGATDGGLAAGVVRGDAVPTGDPVEVREGRRVAALGARGPPDPVV